MQIGTYLERALDTELSGNVIDLCPVGALTSKPYAFKARPWELKKVESIDVHDALGSNIQVHSRGVEVVRVIPRLNDDVNEEWISDKTRFANDGLKNQRLTTPLVKKGDRFEAASWDEALQTIADAVTKLQPKGNEIKAIAGHLADAESMVALKDMLNKMGSENCTVDSLNGGIPPAHGVDIRSNYLFNSSAHGVESATAILLVGTNPRHEAAVLNARIRKAWTSGPVNIGLVGEDFDSIFEYEKLGTDLASLKKAFTGKFGQTLAKADKPMIIIGSAVTEHSDAPGFFEAIAQFVGKNEKAFFQPEWNGYNILQRVTPPPIFPMLTLGRLPSRSLRHRFRPPQPRRRLHNPQTPLPPQRRRNPRQIHPSHHLCNLPRPPRRPRRPIRRRCPPRRSLH
jgi:NADH dehydrogenase (ubiquinone) Fe-S protein 1